MPLRAGDLDRRVAILRTAKIDDGTATVDGPPTVIGWRWAQKTDVSDGERVRAGQQGQDITTRFVVRWDALTATITAKDYIALDGLLYEVTGAKEVESRREAIEITTNAQRDLSV